MTRTGRPSAVNKGVSVYSNKTFYYPLDMGYAKIWTYVVNNYHNKGSVIRKSLFKYLFDHIKVKEARNTANDDDREIKQFIIEAMKRENIWST